MLMTMTTRGMGMLLVGLMLAGCASVPPPIPAVAPTAVSIVATPVNSPRQRHFNALSAKGGFDVMFVGDSITQGWEGCGKAVWDKEIAPFKAANFGTSGERTEQVLWRFQHGNLDGKLNPKVMVFMLGTNNTGHRNDKPEEVAAGVGAILKTFHERFPQAKILLLAIFPRGADARDGKRLNNEAANALLAKFDGHWNIKYLDIKQKFLAPDGTLPKTIMPDLLHPNANGYQIWADAIVPEIRAALGK